MNWLKKNRVEVFIFLSIILLAAFLRLYRINEYMTFLGDEGRDALVVKRILVLHETPLLGPPTSIGNIYLGPLYYYMMAVAMAFDFMNPVAAAIMVAILGVATVGLIYYLSRQWFGREAAIISSLLYAISPVVIYYSRSSWNPNPAPFFALAGIFSLYKLHKTSDGKWLLLTGVATAFAVQMHYLALILVPIYGSLWFFELLKRRDERKNFWLGTLGAVIMFCLLMSPLMFFDLRHDFLNYKAIVGFFTNRETTVNLNLLNTTTRILPIYSYNVVERLITDTNILLKSTVAILMVLPIGWLVFNFSQKRKIEWPFLALSVWLIIGVLGLALYKQTIFDHYLGFLYPVPFLLLGSVFYLISSHGGKKLDQILKGSFLFLVLILLVVNLTRSPLNQSPNNQLERTQKIAHFIIAQAQSRPFNFALIAKSNYDAAYKFYLDQYGYPSKIVPLEITDQLFVVCEDRECNPVGHPKQEISHFGWSKIDWEEDIYGVKIFKLIHNSAQFNAK